MFIKLTDLNGESIFINADKIMWFVPYSTKGHTEASIVFMSADACVKVSESPDMIVKLIERSENGK